MWTALLLGFLAHAPIEAAFSVFSPGTSYDAAIPTLETVVGHDFGEEMSTHRDIVDYLNALHGAAPDRSRLIEYGKSWEGRALYVLVIASPERMARLEAIQADVRRLARAEADAHALIETLPVVSWFAHSVHGDELSSSDAALAEAYHLLAARGDDGVDTCCSSSTRFSWARPTSRYPGWSRPLSFPVSEARAR